MRHDRDEDQRHGHPLQRGIARGEVRPDVDIRSAATLVAAPPVYRLLVEREPPDVRFVEDLVDPVVRAVGHPGI
ncbi:TetR-like C-terminal domain-containing protein [Streptomyces sp. Tue6028]|uniref:TetR-like C-terminal domain-containing protein n=1 Tax=Streptomyces sp. Tue6028 TaxID=2036037 RepID=UPI003EB70F15